MTKPPSGSIPTDMATPSSDDSAPVLGYRVDDGVCTITLQRPAAFNAFDSSLKTALLAALQRAAADAAARVLVLTGQGKAFCAGQDLKEHLARVQTGDPTVGATVSDFYNPLITLVTELRKPVIAAVGGVAAGAGAALAFACDLRVASPAASFTMAFAQVALSADSGASFTLPRLVGAGRAMKMMLTGERVDAVEALRIGLVDEVAPDGDADAFGEYVAGFARRLAAGPTDALGWIKASVRYGGTHTLADTLEFEDSAQSACFASADHHEALAAFVEKRAPRFRV